MVWQIQISIFSSRRGHKLNLSEDKQHYTHKPQLEVQDSQQSAKHVFYKYT